MRNQHHSGFSMALRRTAATSRKCTNGKEEGDGGREQRKHRKPPASLSVPLTSRENSQRPAGWFGRSEISAGLFLDVALNARSTRSFPEGPAGILSTYDPPSRRSETLVFRLLGYRASYGTTTFLTRGNEGNRETDGKV